MTAAICGLCPHHCRLQPGQTGLCRGRMNEGGKIICKNYGAVTSLALDPIEKKPLARFHPGGFILSVGSYGCNLRCPFCQNHENAQAGAERVERRHMEPEELAGLALELAKEPRGNLGLAFTYNEPLISYEYILDTARLVKAEGLSVVLVTNGTICREPLEKLLPYVDALNIDLKGFNQAYYDWLGGDFETVRQTISLAAEYSHVEVTTLIVPGKNDSPEEMEAEAVWLAGLSPKLPLHISRYFPRFRCDIPATPVTSIAGLVERARRHLRYVYAGNCVIPETHLSRVP